MMSSRFSQWEDSRQISVSFILMSHDLSQPIIIGYLGQRHTDERHYEDPHRCVELEKMQKPKPLSSDKIFKTTGITCSSTFVIKVKHWSNIIFFTLQLLSLNNILFHILYFQISVSINTVEKTSEKHKNIQLQYIKFNLYLNKKKDDKY